MNNKCQVMRRGGAWSGFYLRKNKPVWGCGAYLSRDDAEKALAKCQHYMHFTVFLCKGEDWRNPIKAFYGDLRRVKSLHVKKLLEKLKIL